MKTLRFALALAVFTMLARADPAAPQEAQIDKDNFAVTLADGLTIQVYGVSQHPSDGTNWWKPDGSPLDPAPYDKFPGGEVRAVNAEIREIAYRVSNQPQEPDEVSVDITPHGTASSSSGAEKGGQLTDISANAIAFPAATKSINITWTIASGKWETRATTRGDGMLSQGTGKNNVIFLPAHAADKGAAIAVVHDFGNVAARVLAIGQDDAEHPSSGYLSSSIKGVAVSEFHFDIPPDQIKEYRLQTRPWDTQVKFENISLNAGENVGEKIEIGAPKK